MAEQSRVRIRGLRELRRAFRDTGSRKFDRHLTKANRTIADKVIERARPKLAAVSKTTAAAMEPVRTATGARIRVSRVDAPQAAGVIFGAGHDFPRIGPSGRRWRGYNQFRSWWGGPYHIFPEIAEMHDEIADQFMDAIDEFLDAEGVPRG